MLAPAVTTLAAWMALILIQRQRQGLRQMRAGVRHQSFVRSWALGCPGSSQLYIQAPLLLVRMLSWLPA